MATSCPSCGAPVDLAFDEELNMTVPLDISTDAASDAPRYRIVDFRDGQAYVRRVAPGAMGKFQADHRYDCPAHNAGRR